MLFFTETDFDDKVDLYSNSNLERKSFQVRSSDVTQERENTSLD